jgi:nucleoside-diphosphate-sugar epimerase
MTLTVAVTGPTGDIGRPLMRSLEKAREIGRVRAMGRRPVDPAKEGWRKVEYVRGDVLDRSAVDQLVEGADVVVHLAFAIMEDRRRTNLGGSRTVFEAAVAAGVRRLVYVSSVAAYGFHPDNPQPLTEEVEARGTDGFYYSAHKAELERVVTSTVEGTSVDAYVFRPCIVAGPESLLLIRSLPYVQVSALLPEGVRRMLANLPVGPVLPDFGIPFQLLHADDLALALRAAVLGRGEPGSYNVAGPGEVTVQDLADELGWHAFAVPPQAVDALADLVERMPFAPARASWLNAFRHPVIMDTAKARTQLRWRPRHDARSTLRETVQAAREAGLLGGHSA